MDAHEILGIARVARDAVFAHVTQLNEMENDMSFLALLKFLLGIAPLVTQGVVAIEAAMPNTPGTQKLAAVLNSVTVATQHATDAVGTAEQIVAPVTALVNGIVASFNAAGVFTKAKPASDAATPAVDQRGP